MSPSNNPDNVIAQDIEPGDASEAFGIAEPYSQAEIEDLLYGEDRPASERLARLRELRDEASVRESGDWGDQDPAASLAEIDRAIDELSAMTASADELDENYAELAPTIVYPGERLDALSPDDTDAIAAIEGESGLDEEDDANKIAPLDETEWDDGDDLSKNSGR